MEVFEKEPGNKVNLAELFKGKKGVLFGLPGAFTPGHKDSSDTTRAERGTLCYC